MDRRGQMYSTPMVPMVVLMVLLICMIVINKVMSSMEVAMENAAANITHLCNGVKDACGDGGGVLDLLGFSLSILIATSLFGVVLYIGSRFRSSNGNADRSQSANVEFLKQRYLDDRLTERELEAKLEWQMYIDIDHTDEPDVIDRQLQQDGDEDGGEDE